MFCQECGTKVEPGQVFCLNCGAKLEGEEISAEETAAYEDEKTVFIKPEKEWEPEMKPEMKSEPEPVVVQKASNENVFCPHCGALNNRGNVFCANCGGSMNGMDAKPSVKKKTKLPLVVGGIAVGALAVAAVATGAFSLIGGKSGSLKEQVYYIKDEDLYRTSLKKIEAVEVDSNILDEDNNMTGGYIGAKYSEDERYLFYFHINDSGEKSLYYIDTKEKEANAEKIDSSIDSWNYVVTQDNQVIYKKNESLYIHDLKEKEKIASDIDSFAVSEDGNTVMWMSAEDRKLYVQDTALKNEKEKLDSEIDYIVFQSGDLSDYVYVKEGSVYLIEDMGEKEKIASDVSEVVAVGYSDSGIQIVYLEAESSEVPMSEFVKDDMSADVDVKEPEDDEYNSYQRRQYEEKRDRDRFREDLETYTMYITNGKLTLYDSEADEKTVIKEGYINYANGYDEVNGKAVTVYCYVDNENMPSVKFSEAYENGIGYIESEVNRALEEKATTYLAVGERSAEFLDNDRELDRLVSDGEKLYAITCERNSDNERIDYELGEVSTDEDSLGEFTKLYADVNDLISCDGGDLIYIKDCDYEHQTCDLYQNDEKIDSDVYPYSVFQAENGSLLYFTDMSDSVGTAKLYDGKTSKKIADDAGQAYYIADNKIVVLMDMSKKSKKGDLKFYNGKELEKIDTDVSGIVKL